MKVKIEKSTILKPIYDDVSPPSTAGHVPLSVFDVVAYDSHVAIIYAYRPPTPNTSTLKRGLQKVLSHYREWAGQLGYDIHGHPVILLNDNGARFVEASVDSRLDQATTLLMKPSPEFLSFHPSVKGVEELLQVQVTRFTCGSMVIGFTSHHSVADGHSTSNFLVAWGRASRGLDLSGMSPNLHDRISLFVPRNPPCIDFDHEGTEYTSKKLLASSLDDEFNHINDDQIVVHKVHFSMDFLSKLKVRANKRMIISNNIYSTFQSLVAHLWRAITRARSLTGNEITQVRISVNGRSRLNPRIPNHYFGNLVLWALPTARVKDLLREPLPHAAKLIHDAVAKVNNNYFRSFIDYESQHEEDDDRIPTAVVDKPIMCPDIDVDSWLRFPFYDLDFGCGSPYMFMPSYFPTEGMIFLLPSFIGDGSIDAFVPLLKHHLDCFNQYCYTLD